MAEDVVAEADLADSNPDVGDLFQHYDRLYFRGALADAGFAVKWGSLLPTSSFGSCTFSKPRNTITLSEPVLKYLSCTHLKNAMLHEMIHAIIYIKHQRKDRYQHGPLFRSWMDAINSCSVQDQQRPDGGYNITTRHDFSPEEPHNLKGNLWQCESCGDTLLRATNQGPPSDACYIENADTDASCGNMLCHWHSHKNGCCGTYEKTTLELQAPSQKIVPGGSQLLLTFPSEMSKSKGSIQESGSCALKGNTKATKPNAKDKHLSLVSASNGKPQGSSSSEKTSKKRRPEVLGTSVLLAESPRKSKRKQDLIAAEHDFLSLDGCATPKSPRSSTSKKVVKAGKQHKPDDQKPSGLPASPQGKLDQKHGLDATEKQEFLSEGYNDVKPPAGMQHEPQIAQNTCSQLAHPQQRLKQDLIALEKKEFSSAIGCSDEKLLDRSSSKKAHRQHEPEDIRKTAVLKAGDQHELQVAQKQCSQLAYPQKRLKQDWVAPQRKEFSPAIGCSDEKLVDRSSSKKAHWQHEPEEVRETNVLAAVPGTKPKASCFVASEKQRKGKCKRKPVREKEYAVMSAWLDFYESDKSSGSTEPLVNKRTERRKRERERARITTYSRSRKINPAPLVNSRTDEVSSRKINMLPHKDESPQQSQPPPPCSDTAVLAAANQVVATQATGDHSQPSAPCLDIVPLQPADPPVLTPPDQSMALDIIYISDDD